MAFINKDEVEKFRRDFFVVHHGHRFFRQLKFSRVDLFGGFVQLAALEDGIQALDSADAHLAILGDK